MREGGHHHASRRRRCLEEAGFVAEVAPTGRRYWRTPETGDLISEERAFALAKDDEERALEAAGWEPENVDGDTYWRRPDSGSLYPRGAAYDVLRGTAKEYRV